MKSFSNVMMIAALSIAAVCSCTKDKLVNANGNELQTIYAGMADSKVTVDGMKVLWDKTDSISLYSSGSSKGVIYKSSITKASASAAFSLEAGQSATAAKISEKYYAVTPVTAFESNAWNGGVTAIDAVVSFSQTAMGPDMLPVGGSLLYSSSADENFTFKHALGYVAITLDGDSPEDLKAISVTSIANNVNLSGRFNFNLDDATVSPQASSYNRNYVTLRMKNNALFDTGTYYIGLIPGTYTSGLTFTFVNSEGKAARKTINKSLTLKSGEVKNVGTVTTLEYGATAPKVGDAYKEGDTVKGIVAVVDDSGYYLVMSLDETKVAWSTNNTDLVGVASNSTYGKIDTDKIIASHLYSATVFPSVAFCVGHGEGWYMPSRGEFTAFKNAAIVDNSATAFKEKLTALGGTAFQDTQYYWMVNEKSNTSAWYDKFFASSGAIAGAGSGAKTTTRYVRAFKRVEY